MRNCTRLGLVLLAAAALMGCNNKQKNSQALLQEENESLRAQLAERNAAIEQLNAELRNQQSSGGGMTGSAPANSDGITWTAGNGEIRATISSDVLFDSGKTTLKSSAKKSLDSVVSVFNSKYPGWMVRIEGHTDSDPIRKSGFKTNDHLGFERAFAVKEYLTSKGLPEKQVALASYGPNIPAGTKAQSRRVEIVAVQP